MLRIQIIQIIFFHDRYSVKKIVKFLLKRKILSWNLLFILFLVLGILFYNTYIINNLMFKI